MTASDTPAEDRYRPLLERQVEMLGRLAEIGMQIAEAIAEPRPEPADKAKLFAVFAPVSRAIRLSLMLQERLIADLRRLDRGETLDPQEQERRSDRRKDQAVHIIERIAERDHREPHEVDHLAFEASERLDHDDLYGDVLSRPLSDLVSDICRDLGLDPDWPTLVQEAWARQEMESGAIGIPLLAYAPEPSLWIKPSPHEASDRRPPDSS